MKKLVVLAIYLLFAISCSKQNTATEPEAKLIGRLNSRFENQDYIYSNPLANPYDEIGGKIQQFHSKISSEFKPQRKLYNAGFFQLASERKTWGIQDSEKFQKALTKIKEFSEANGDQFDSEKFIKINERLNSYYQDESGVNDMLEYAHKNKAISETQKTILKSTFLQLKKAKTLKEALAINETLEYEVANSEIKENDKAFLLSMSSIIKHRLQGHLLSYNAQGNSTFAAEAAAVIVVAIVVDVAIGAVVGGVVGSLSCWAYNDFTWDCVSNYVYSGALVGLVVGLVVEV